MIISSADDFDISSPYEVYITDTYARIPNYFIERRVWLNLVLDIRNLFNCIFRGCTYRSIEGIVISSFCKIRRVMGLGNSQMQLISLIGFQAGDQSLGINSILP